ncbi:PREDICTED: guanylate-binding protein 6-like [Gekko japonicus]|uniref:Guanylate-binding protein 6-like n=1 Tax=Gekko japonicus TaxID=146911 RepID=A0ABM1JTT0_GEKJA|nr:PREDICTED: guanylate-binding protein 6-like [Gekko japonicus]
MSASRVMESICLVEPSPDSRSLRVNTAALSFLKSVTGRLWVVAIFGPKGTGKSFLLDQLVGQDGGSPRSAGIWLRCSPHPTRPDENLVFLDTEGLPEKMEKHPPCRYVKMLPDKVRVLEDCPMVNRFLLSSMLPDFVWCLRDVASEERVLQDVDLNLDLIVSPPAVSASENTTISCIQTLFPSQKVFCFCSPHADGKDGEVVSSDILHPMFQARLCSFKDYILNQRPKNSPGSRFSNGKDWSAVLERFADVLSLNEPIIVNESFDPQAFYLEAPWAAPKRKKRRRRRREEEIGFRENYENSNEPMIDPEMNFPRTTPKRKKIPRAPQVPVQEPRNTGFVSTGSSTIFLLDCS